MIAQVTGKSLSVQYVMRGVRKISEHGFDCIGEVSLEEGLKTQMSTLCVCQDQKAQPDAQSLARRMHAASHPNVEPVMIIQFLSASRVSDDQRCGRADICTP
jgi:hypothetical protein